MLKQLLTFICILIGIKLLISIKYNRVIEKLESFTNEDLGGNILTKGIQNWSGPNEYITNIGYTESAPNDESTEINKVMSFSIKPRLDSKKVGFLYDYSDNVKMIPGESYSLTIYAKTDSLEGLQVQPYTGDNEESKDTVSRVWMNSQVVKGGEGWKKLIWTFKNHINSKAESLSFKFVGSTDQGIRHTIFKPELRNVLKVSIAIDKSDAEMEKLKGAHTQELKKMEKMSYMQLLKEYWYIAAILVLSGIILWVVFSQKDEVSEEIIPTVTETPQMEPALESNVVKSESGIDDSSLNVSKIEGEIATDNIDNIVKPQSVEMHEIMEQPGFPQVNPIVDEANTVSGLVDKVPTSVPDVSQPKTDLQTKVGSPLADLGPNPILKDQQSLLVGSNAGPRSKLNFPIAP